MVRCQGKTATPFHLDKSGLEDKFLIFLKKVSPIIDNCTLKTWLISTVNFNIYIAFYNKRKYNKSNTILSEVNYEKLLDMELWRL